MAKYLRYIIKNLEPVRVADDESSQSGQTSSISYIPGSSVRGLVVNRLSEDADFEQIKALLFSEETVFMNLYPTVKDHPLMPSPKGFYEDKSIVEGKKEIQNVVINGDFSDGMKRASLGSFCYIEDGCIYYYTVETGSDMRILINPEEGMKRNVFRLELLSPLQYFEGYIKLTGDEKLDERICSIFRSGNELKFGNARSIGMGKCLVLMSEISGLPLFGTEFFRAEAECYMILLSDSSMLDESGNYCGLNLPELEQKLGITNLKIKYASTSVRTVCGYNRTWGGKTASVPAYSAGSVFHLTFDGVIEKECMQKLAEDGIGVCRNQGMGRVGFLYDYGKVCMKIQGEDQAFSENGAGTEKKELSEKEIETLKTVAKNYYRNKLEDYLESFVLKHPLNLNGVKKSQLGQIEAYLLGSRYEPGKAYENLERYLGHALDKSEKNKVQKERASVAVLGNQILKILDKPIEETLFGDNQIFKEKGKVMGIPVSDIFDREDDEEYRIKLVIQMIRFKRKEG